MRALRTTTIFAVLIALVLTLAGCAGNSGKAKLTSDGKVILRYQSIAGSVDTLQLADALGYLPNIKLDKQGDVTGGPQMLQALVSDQTDIATTPFFGATAQLIATGAPIKAVVSVYGSSGGISSSLVVPDGSPIKEAKDLIGKKIAVNTLGANAEAVLDTWFAQEGLTTEEQDQITLVALPPLNTEAALRENQIDAAYMSSGFLEIAKKRGGLVEVVKDTDVVGPYNGGGAVLTERFIEQNKEAATEVTTGIAKAVKYIAAHEREETLEIYTKWLEDNGYGDGIEAVEANWSGATGVPTENAEIREEDISLWLDWLESRGDVDPSKIDASDVFTNDLNKEAGA